MIPILSAVLEAPISMYRRIASALFILILAGSVWASVCGCGDSTGPRMKCCKKSSAQKTMGKKQCCGTVCGYQGEQAASSITPDRVARIDFADEAPDATPFFTTSILVSTGASHLTPNLDSIDAPKANPPDLFLLHRSFRL